MGAVGTWERAPDAGLRPKELLSCMANSSVSLWLEDRWEACKLGGPTGSTSPRGEATHWRGTSTPHLITAAWRAFCEIYSN